MKVVTLFVLPKGIEPLSKEPESFILSIELQELMAFCISANSFAAVAMLAYIYSAARNGIAAPESNILSIELRRHLCGKAQNKPIPIF